MPERVGWTRDQQLIALRLYMGTTFGRLHRNNPEIIALAERIGRSPNALAMKACNFASLDPGFRASGRKGLSGASDADRALWAEFAGDSERVADEAEQAFARLDPKREARDQSEIRMPSGDTDVERVVRARRVQSFFRAAIITSYESRCAISGITIPELLVASHIIPWSVSIERRADPTNGLCLNALFDRAFDRGLISVDPEMRVIVSHRLRSGVDDATLDCSLREVEGRQLLLPGRLPPDTAALTFHRQHVFQS